MPDDLRLTPGDAVLLAQRLIDDGRPFHAHEVLEATWKSSPAAERELWRGLAQIAVGLTHARRGNSRGAVTLLRRGAGTAAACMTGGQLPAGLPGELDPVAASRTAQELADRIAASGLGAVPPGDLRISLTG